MKIRVVNIFIAAIILLVVAPLLSAKGGKLLSNDTASLTDVEIASILFMREEEKLARDVYLTLGDFWSLTVFDNIAASEQQHMNAMKKLVGKFALEDPVVDDNDVGSFANDELSALYPALVGSGEQSRHEALLVGAFIEEVDMEDIRFAIDTTDRSDIRKVYESLLCGSRNHLRAFVAQIESNGEVYESQLYPADDEWVAFINSVIDSPVERSCGARKRR